MTSTVFGQSLKIMFRRDVRISLGIMAGLNCVAGMRADAMTRIQVGDMGGYESVRDQMRDQLIFALKKTGRMDVVPSASDRPSYRIDPALTKYGVAESANNGMIQASKVTVEMSFRIVDLRTNSTVDSFQTSGQSYDGGTRMGENAVQGAGFGTANWFQYDPVGRATKEALDYGVVQILQNIPDLGDAAFTPHAAAQSAELSSPIVCPFQEFVFADVHHKLAAPGESFVECRPLQVFKSAHKVKVLLLKGGKEDLIGITQLRQLVPLSGPPKIGARVLVSSKTEGVLGGLYKDDYPHVYVPCKVGDIVDQTAMLVCWESEFTLPFTSLMTAKPIANIEEALPKN